MGPNSIVALGVIPRKLISCSTPSRDSVAVATLTFGESPNAERRVGSDFFCVVHVSSVKHLNSSRPVTQAREEHRQGTWLVECQQCLRQYCTPTRNHLHRYYSHDAQRIGPVIPCIPGLKDLYSRLSECSITGAKKRLRVRATRQALLSRRNKWTVEAIKQIPEFRAKRWMAPVMRDLSCTAYLSQSSSSTSRVPFVVTSLNAAYREPARA
jgi:hypothetical protein